MIAWNTRLYPTPEFILIPLEDGVLIDGGREPELMSGVLAISVLPILLPHLRSGITLQELHVLVPKTKPSDLEALVKALCNWRLLTTREADVGALSGEGRTLSALCRFSNHFQRDHAKAALCEQTTVVLADDVLLPLAKKVSAALIGNGFRHLSCVSMQDKVAETVDFVVRLALEGDACHHRALLDITPLVQPWLRVVVDAGLHSVEIGPIFFPDTTLCMHCSGAMRARAAPTLASTKEDPLVFELFAATVASEVTTSLLEDLRPLAVRRYEMPSLKSEWYTWPTEALCSCRVAADGRQKHLPSLLEAAVARRKDESDVCRQRNIELQSTPRHYSHWNEERCALPTTDIALAQGVFALLTRPSQVTEQLNLTKLSVLLSLCAGLRFDERQSKRWCPSAGNLGSVGICVITAGLDGLAAGVWRYHSESHELFRVTFHDRNVLPGTQAALGCEAAETVLVFIGSYKRVSLKYDAFAYKLIQLDAGVASAQLTLVASALGLPLACVSGWHTRLLSDALRLVTEDEVPLAAFNLNSSVSCKRTAEDEVVSPCVISPSFEHGRELVRRILCTDILVSSSLSMTTAYKGPKTGLLERLSIFASDRPLGECLRERRSMRSFAHRAIGLNKIKLILKAALTHSALREPAMQLHVHALAVESLSPGIYKTSMDSGDFTRVADLTSSAQLRRSLLDSTFPGVSAIFWISADVSLLTLAAYQNILQLAGLLGQRLWMAAVSLKLAGSLIAGISSESSRQEEEWLESRQYSLLALLCGHPNPVQKDSHVS